jgi:hypothetical protein
MTTQEKIQFKTRLKQTAVTLIGERVSNAKQAIDQAQQAANQEEKSSAGDKYETARAMGHLQKDMHSRQLAELVKELSVLHAVNTGTLYTAAGPGSFIQCAGIAFFIAAGMGKQIIEGQTILFLSPQAPLARLLQGRKIGEEFLFNQVKTIILDLY